MTIMNPIYPALIAWAFVVDSWIPLAVLIGGVFVFNIIDTVQPRVAYRRARR